MLDSRKVELISKRSKPLSQSPLGHPPTGIGLRHRAGGSSFLGFGRVSTVLGPLSLVFGACSFLAFGRGCRVINPFSLGLVLRLGL